MFQVGYSQCSGDYWSFFFDDIPGQSEENCQDTTAEGTGYGISYGQRGVWGGEGSGNRPVFGDSTFEAGRVIGEGTASVEPQLTGCEKAP